jgi:hypothetical protein
MTATPVNWVLDELGAVVDAQPDDHPLKRVDRDNALLYDGSGDFDMSGSVRSRTGELQTANFVGASYADRSESYVGTAPNLDLDEVVSLRIEGLHHSEWGHVDPAGDEGVVFHGTDTSLVQQVTDTLLDALAYPDAGRTSVAFTHLSIEHFPDVSAYADHYDYRLDITFDGFEAL